jgi:hypothetical protein
VQVPWELEREREKSSEKIGAATLSKTALSITTIGIMGSFATLKTECSYADCCCYKSRIFLCWVLSMLTLSCWASLVILCAFILSDLFMVRVIKMNVLIHHTDIFFVVCHYAECWYVEHRYSRLHHTSYWVLFCCVLLCWMLLCWVSLFCVSFCWVTFAACFRKCK